MASARKKIIVRRFSHGLLRGYLEPSHFIRNEASTPLLQVLDLAGRLQEIPLNDVKWVSFVREFNLNDEVAPERMPRKTFFARPRTEGLWLRIALRDDDQIEGLAPLDLSLADNLLEDRGVQIVPPDIRGNAQRIYIPRAAMISFQVVAVVTSPSRRKAMASLPVRERSQVEQPGLFPPAVSNPASPQ